MPTVSVVLPTYKRSDFLGRSIASVLAQTFTDWELLVVDDNDPDSTFRRETAAFMERYGGDGRIRYLRHERNKGGSAARNTGIAAARGDLVAFLDDDDEWAREKLTRQVELFGGADERLGLVYCGFRKVFVQDGISQVVLPSAGGHALGALLVDNGIGTTSTVLARRAVLEAVGGFDETLASRQDIDLYVRVARDYRIDFVPEALVTWYRHSAESIGTNRGRMIEAHRAFLAKYPAEFARYPAARARRHMALGQLLLAEGRLAEARAAFSASWRDRRLSLAAPLYLALANRAGYPIYRGALRLKSKGRSVRPARTEGAT